MKKIARKNISFFPQFFFNSQSSIIFTIIVSSFPRKSSKRIMYTETRNIYLQNIRQYPRSQLHLFLSGSLFFFSHTKTQEEGRDRSKKKEKRKAGWASAQRIGEKREARQEEQQRHWAPKPIRQPIHIEVKIKMH